MGREIKFRGKRLEDGKWIFGNLVVTSDGKCLIQPWIRTEGVGYTHPIDSTGEVNPETVGEFTGLRDKNGTEIYEGDIVRLRNAVGFHCPATVEFTDGCFDVRFQTPLWDPQQGVNRNRDYLKVFVANHACEVIGNIYEHADLLANTVSE